MRIRQLPDGRYVDLYDDGTMLFCKADGALIAQLTAGDQTYVQLGFSEEVCVIDRLDARGAPTVFWEDGSVKVAKRHACKFHPLNLTTVTDPHVIMWVGDERARAFATRDQSNEFKYGARHPTGEQIDGGGSNVIP